MDILKKLNGNAAAGPYFIVVYNIWRHYISIEVKSSNSILLLQFILKSCKQNYK